MKSRTFQSTFAVFALATALVVLAFAALAGATQPGINGKIAFAADTGVGSQLYTINPDGTGLFQLTNVNGSVFSPDWSPDGRRIAFEFDDDTHGGIAIINADGTGFTDLTPTGFHSQPAFTPDGHHLLYECVDCSGGDGIFLMQDDASDFPGLRLTTNPFPGPFPEGDSNPEVSPDGKTVTFVRHQVDGQLQALFAVNIDGTNERLVAPYTFEVAIKHDWAPDGGRIVITPFADFPDNRSPDVATIKPDGSDVRLLTKYTGGAVGAFAGSYSPDGRWITFRLQGPHTFGLWVMSSNGGNRKLIANFPFRPRTIDWGPQPEQSK